MLLHLFLFCLWVWRYSDAFWTQGANFGINQYNNIIHSMNKKAQWILSEEEIRILQKHRNQHYQQLQYPVVDHASFNRGYLHQFVKFVRERKKKYPAEYPFKFQKIVYYAVALYKRYYLVNTYICEDLSYTQSMICCIYLSLKYNEYDDDFMLKMATKWKPKPFFGFSKNPLPHYGDQNYTQAQLKFLSGIKFQTGLSKVITPIEAMYHAIIKGRNTNQQIAVHSQKDEDTLGIRECIFDTLNLLYGHPTLMFLFDGPKIALSIIYQALRQKNVPYQNLGEDLTQIIEENLPEIEQIILMMEQEKEHGKNQKYESERQKIVNFQGFKKPFHKSQLTPRLQPRHDAFLQLE